MYMGFALDVPSISGMANKMTFNGGSQYDHAERKFTTSYDIL